MASFPPALKEGSTIGIVSPARWAEPAWIDALKTFLESRGFHVVVHPQNDLRDGQLAGPDDARAQALRSMFADPKIDAIMCARGGTGSLRLLDRLDYGLIGKNPKPFVGFSDITALLHAITKRCGFVTYHGPMALSFGKQRVDPRTGEDLLNALCQSQNDLAFANVSVAREGQAEGVLIGGNMALLQTLIGTPFDWSGRDAILFLEDTDEPLYKIDRVLKHFRLAGKFDGVRAVLIGEMINITDGETGADTTTDKPYGRSLEQIVQEHVPAGIPLAFNVPCGHGAYTTTIPVGAQARLNLNAKISRMIVFD